MVFHAHAIHLAGLRYFLLPYLVGNVSQRPQQLQERTPIFSKTHGSPKISILVRSSGGISIDCWF